MEHARTCGAAFETLRCLRAGYRYFPADVGRKNFIHISQKRCMKKRVELDPDEIFDANVLPCSVNCDQHSPIFFILADSKVAGAVFILVKAKEEGRARVKYHKLKLVARLEGLPINLELQEEININR